MMILPIYPNLRKICLVWLGLLAGTGMVVGCGGGGGGGGDGRSPADNQKPTASISSPSGASFKEGEVIAFSGSATDAEDGTLPDSALVWTSSKDGTIGTGATLITSALSPGDHDITLTATDSGGATATATIATISIVKTRFIKMGTQTTGVPDASNAFDGDMDTAAAIMTPDTEFIHFKAYLGVADTFLFKIKLGASTAGSPLAIQGLDANDNTWKTVSAIGLDSDKTVAVKIADAQNYKDTDSYINLRVGWEVGGNGDIATIFEIWRVDPAYNGPETSQDVLSPESAFDGDPDTFSTFAPDPIFLHFKAYVGQATTAAYKMSLDGLGGSHNTLFIDAETAPNDWAEIDRADLTSTQTMTLTFTVQDVQSYLDEDGYISLRAIWTKGSASSDLKIREISRIDPFIVGSETTSETQFLSNPENAVDGDPDSAATIYNYWDEAGRNDALYVQTYLGDAPVSGISMIAAPSALGSQSELILEGETAPGIWSPIVNYPLVVYTETPIEILNARRYVDADGLLKLRVRWLSDSSPHNALIYEVQRAAQ